MDLGLCARRPDENLQRVGFLVLASKTICHKPVSYGASRFLQEGANPIFEKPRVLDKMHEEGSSLHQGQLRRKPGEPLQLVSYPPVMSTWPRS